MQYTDSALLVADTTVKAAPGHVKSITIAYKGVTAGERIVTLVNATSGSTPDLWVFVAPAANGTFTKTWAGEGKSFSAGIRFNKGPTAGLVYSDIQFH